MQENEKRILIAVLLTVLIIVFYDYFFMPKPENISIKSVNQTTKLVPNLSSIENTHIQNNKNMTANINSNDLDVSISLTDGTIKNLLLKTYKQDNKYINLADPNAKIGLFYTQFEDSALQKKSLEGQYNVDIKKHNGATIVLLTKAVGDIKIIKRYVFKNYGIVFETNVYKNDQSLNAKYSLLLNENFGKSSKDSHVGAVALINDKIKTDKDIGQIEKLTWIALEDKYFCVALYDNTLLSGGFKEIDSNKYIYVNLNTNSSIYSFAGPKSSSIISAYDPKLDRIVRFGTFGFIGKPLLYVLKYLYSIVGNYGLAIILLTFFIRLIFYPLTYKSFKSMKAMANLQPQLKELQLKYKGKPELLNKSTMELYKKHKVNPLGGCLPILIQIPVFIALYNVLLNAIELRHAPFIFWITDLSAKDPYYITPIIMGLTMFIQQKLSPSTLDPMQAKIMLFLPIIFTIMFMGFPSGLVLYWIANNVFTIIQQLIDTRIIQAKAKAK
ncbi:MAG: membrane protein insertase YidC [Desulfurella sp.]|uniref:membrane protein insertase YidC n=1 Tax=Desulfurella sp. TaxID=1962857 RepID=UPI003CA15443